MANLWPAEATNNDPEIGGFVVQFPSGATKAVSWRSQPPIPEPLDAAKQYAAKLIEHLSARALNDDMERTNWASMVASIQKIILDFNERRRLALYGSHATTRQ